MGCDGRFDDGVRRADERKKIERLFPDISRQTIAEERRSLMPNGDVRDQLKTPYADRMTDVIFEELDLNVCPAVLVPKPQVNLALSEGIFEPKSTYCAQVTPAKRGKEGQPVTRASEHPANVLEVLARGG